MPLTLTDGFRRDQRGTATALFWEAFHGKLAPILRPEDKAMRFLNRVAPQSGAALPPQRPRGAPRRISNRISYPTSDTANKPCTIFWRVQVKARFLPVA